MASLYEIVVIISPNEDDDGVDAIIGGLRTQIESSGGDILRVDKWGRRRLAYRIQRFEDGIYVLFQLEGPPTLPNEFRAHTRYRESILREIVVRLTGAQGVVVRKQLAELEISDEDKALAAAQVAAAGERAIAKAAALAAGEVFGATVSKEETETDDAVEPTSTEEDPQVAPAPVETDAAPAEADEPSADATDGSESDAPAESEEVDAPSGEPTVAEGATDEGSEDATEKATDESGAPESGDMAADGAPAEDDAGSAEPAESEED